MRTSLINRSNVQTCPRVNRTRCVVAKAAAGKSGPAEWFGNAAISLATAAAVTLTSGFLQFAPPAEARLTDGNPVKTPGAILRNALPISNKPIREAQKALESISEELRIPGQKSLGAIAGSVRGAQGAITNGKDAIIKDFAPAKKADGIKALEALDASLSEFLAIINAGDKQAVPTKQRETLDLLTRVEEAMVKGPAFDVPKQYADLPALRGRATMEMKVSLKETPEGPKTVVLKIVADGYSAPLSAGAFVDLVERGFYNGMEIQRSDGFVIQTGDPEGDDEGFRDPKTGEIRRVPLEVLMAGDKEPIYEESVEDLGRVNENVVLPFNTNGTLAWARNEFENNSASSQVFFLLKESELTPSGSNMLDGRFAVLGYVTEGMDSINYMKVGDKIQYIKVTEGKENLVNGP